MTPTAFGGLLGLLNTLVIGIGISTVAPHDRITLTMGVLLIGGIPGGLIGVVLGSIAGTTAHLARWQRLAVLVPPALCTAFLLAYVCTLVAYFPLACIPTVAAVLILERHTRNAATLPVALASHSR